MKPSAFSYLIIFILPFLVSVQAALVSRQAGPTCIATCKSTLYGDSCPDDTDANCLCTQTHFGVDMYLCLGSLCNASDVDDAVANVQDMCDNAAVAVTLGPADGVSTSSTPTPTDNSSLPVTSTTATIKNPSPTSTTRTVISSPNVTTQGATPTPSKGSSTISTTTLDIWALLCIMTTLSIVL